MKSGKSLCLQHILWSLPSLCRVFIASRPLFDLFLFMNHSANKIYLRISWGRNDHSTCSCPWETHSLDGRQTSKEVIETVKWGLEEGSRISYTSRKESYLIQTGASPSGHLIPEWGIAELILNLQAGVGLERGRGAPQAEKRAPAKIWRRREQGRFWEVWGSASSWWAKAKQSNGEKLQKTEQITHKWRHL